MKSNAIDPRAIRATWRHKRASQRLNERDDLIAECQSSSLVDVVDCRRLISASHPLHVSSSFSTHAA